MKISRNNHYIPQMYLSRWLSNERIPTYQLLVSHDGVWVWNRKPIKQTGSLPNLYVNVRNEKEYDTLEKDLATHFEAPAKTPFDKLCAGEKITADDWQIIANYIAIQYVRTPSFYFWVKEIGKRIIPEQIGIMENELENMKQLPNIDKYNSEKNEYLPIEVKMTDIKPDENHTYLEISTVSGKGFWFLGIKQTMSNKSLIRKHFQRLRWNKIYPPIGEYWPTCDNPVVICDIIGNTIKRASVSGGFMGKTKGILFPVSPQVVLLATTDRSYRWLDIVADKELANMIRTAIVNNAMLYVYSKDEDERIPLIRPRTVDEREFKRIKDSFDNWFETYKEIEGPLLNR